MPSNTKESMKKLLAKLRKKENDAASSRITNETVAEHRERILAGGRKFKYPLQYARHRLVFNAIIISIVAVIAIIAIGYWQLYSAQNTGVFMYRVARVVPVPVASVDGQPVSYGDYLMRYRGAIHFLEQQEEVSFKSEDGQRQLEYYKQQELQNAIVEAYAQKLANSMDITVSDVELEATLKAQRQSSNGEISQQTQEASILSSFGWSPEEYRQLVKSALLLQKVSYAIDDNAKKISDDIAAQVSADGANLQAIADATSKSTGTQVAYGASGLVLKTNQDHGLAIEASKLERGKVSGAIKSTTGDGYYFVRLLDSNDTQVSYEYIQVPLSEMTKRIDSLEKNKKIVRYISIKTDSTQP